ncbi:MAG TPA: metal ABC transporter ATP-binding protein [Candidatus Pseudogracilibacillus intestinigallinarum]|uniref:Metal ABC transporter ATP-binding protein n=1 Tax=Candidatus Pseudogracilibacillus intestinigallinarum TaxID=2838742 RepID=A0A9D1PL73_9BACI|nr:metal ABC transporter ATP-binding protein [Candidatus Pseudogracilibacillus intestinigallinarum]
MRKSIDVQDLTVSYDGNEVLQHISFSIKSGQLIGIIGPNGAGKSTLIKGMLDLIHRDRGDVRIDGKKITKMRKQIAYVPQRSNIDWDFPILVRDTVLLGTYPRLGLFKRPTKTDKKWADECLDKVNMLDYRDRQIGELSGGQQQRVFLARALAQQANYFFLDEPFVGIDVTSENTIIAILKALRDEGKTVFVVHHDLTKVEQYFDQLLLINKKLMKYGDVKEVMQKELMSSAYNIDFNIIQSMGGEA